ncbi:MAG: ATP-binding protein [Lachnospiraceae bacterium]|nr:ATP-binding protein [Lachnospiraceae bacterium]
MQSYIGLEDNFLLENGYLVARLEEIVLAAAAPAWFSEEDINEIFRIMHTIKSSAGIMMYENISILSHKLEDVFSYLRKTYPDNQPFEELAAGILKTADFITAELIKIQSSASADGDSTDIITYLGRLLDKMNEDSESPVPEQAYEIPNQFYIAPKAGTAKKYYHIKVFYRLGTEMSNVCAYSCVFALNDITDEIIYKPANLENNDSAGEIMRNGFQLQFSTLSRIEEIKEIIESSSGEKEFEILDSSIEEYYRGFPESGVPDLVINLDDDWTDPDELVAGAYVIKKEGGKIKSMSGVPARSLPKQEMFQISFDKVNELFALADRLREEAGAVTGFGAGNDGTTNDAYGISNALTETVNELWRLVNSIKKVQFKSLFQKMDRAVYDISRKLGKVVQFNPESEEIEIGRNIADLLTETLIHLIRNAIDHGIEDKETRKAAGKNAKGAIELTAGVDGEEISIVIYDDGCGLDSKKIFAAAEEKGLTDGQEIDKYNAQDIYRFILMPGFSTKERVTEYSGRGVGLDIVVQNITSLGGRLYIDSQLGEWTEISLRLPRN